jgi:hypothetical protein
MDESSLLFSSFNSSSKETELNTTSNTSFESQEIYTPSLKSHIISSIVKNLHEIMEENLQMGNDPNLINLKDNIFYLDQIPNISLEYFIRHLFKYTNMSISSLILAIIYIDQFCEKYCYALNMHNIFRILLIFVYISIKVNEDINIKPEFYSKVTGVSTKDLNMLEFQMCVAMNFDFFIKSDYYQQYFAYFCKNGN